MMDNKLAFAEDLEGLEDYNTIQVDGDDGSAAEDEYPNIRIKIERDQYSIFEMARKYHGNRIYLDPSFQRNFVWSRRQMSELIESIIIGIPLPLIYLAENKDGKMIVVDGRQRLTTFFKFLNNEFKLDKLKIMGELNGKYFRDLEINYPKYAATVEDYQLMIQVIKYPTPDKIRFDIFDRVNRGGTPLNKQEMRNALYQGNATKLLEIITNSEGFKLATGNGISDKRMKDKYVVLRAISFCMINEKELFDQNGIEYEYKSDVDDLLGRVMDRVNHMSVLEIDDMAMNFDRIMRTIHSVLGDNAFRLKGNYGVKRPISMTLFESLYYLFYLLDGLPYDIEKLEEKIRILQEDDEYLNALQISVDSAKNVITRFSKVKDVYKVMKNDKAVRY